MKNQLYLIKNKIPGISYAITTNGIELAVLGVSVKDEQKRKS